MCSTLRFGEQGGKSREIPVRHDLEAFLLEYLQEASLEAAAGDTPLFRNGFGVTAHPIEVEDGNNRGQRPVLVLGKISSPTRTGLFRRMPPCKSRSVCCWVCWSFSS